MVSLCVNFFNIYLGDDFYLGFHTSHIHSVVPSVILTTTESHPVLYSIDAPAVNYYRSGIITNPLEVIIDLSFLRVSFGQSERGVHVKTNSSRVTVVMQSHGNNGDLIDTNIALPITNSLFQEYVYYGLLASQYGEFLIVGTIDNTMVTLSTIQSTDLKFNNTNVKLTPGRHHSFKLNKVQTVLISALKDFKIVTDKPISVFSSLVCIKETKGSKVCDQSIIQIPPITSWGTEYFIAPLATRRSYTIKVLAAYNSTNVEIYCNNARRSYTINEGMIVVQTLKYEEYCVVLASKPVLIAQISQSGNDGSNFDAMVTLVPSADQYSNKVITSTVRKPLKSGYTHYINIIVLRESFQRNMIFLMSGGVKKSLVTQRWVPLRVNGNHEAYATKVTVSEGLIELVHTNTIALMAATVYGFAEAVSYGHSVGIAHRLDKYEGT